MRIIIITLCAALAACGQFNKLRVIPLPNHSAVPEVDYYDKTQSHYVGLAAPDTVGANILFRLPGADGASGAVICTDGSANLVFSGCAGGGSTTPPVTWSLSSASTVLSVSNGGAGDGLRAAANGPGYAINVTAGDSTTTGAWKFTNGGTNTAQLTATGGLTLAGTGISVTNADVNVFNGHFAIGNGGGLRWKLDPHYTVGVQDYLDFLDIAAVSHLRFDALTSKTIVPSGTTLQVDGSTIVNGGITGTHLQLLGTTDTPTFLGLAFSYAFIGTPTVADRPFIYATGSNARWYVGVDGAPESGSNAGSNYYINRYNDAGSLIGAGLTINRASGAIAANGALSGTHLQNLGSGDAPTFGGATISGTTALTAVSIGSTTTLNGATTSNNTFQFNSLVNFGSTVTFGSGGIASSGHGQNIGTIDTPTFNGLSIGSGSFGGIHAQNLGNSDNPTFGNTTVGSLTALSVSAPLAVLSTFSSSVDTLTVANTSGVKNAIRITSGGMLISAGGLSVSAGGLSVSGGISASGSTGVTSSTCSSFKDGICIAP